MVTEWEMEWLVKKTGALLEFIEKEYPVGKWTNVKYKTLMDFYQDVVKLVDSP